MGAVTCGPTTCDGCRGSNARSSGGAATALLFVSIAVGVAWAAGSSAALPGVAAAGPAAAPNNGEPTGWFDGMEWEIDDESDSVISTALFALRSFTSIALVQQTHNDLTAACRRNSSNSTSVISANTR